MKQRIYRIGILMAAMLVPWIWKPLLKSVKAQAPSPVTITLLTPTNGSTISGLIQLGAAASSTAGKIARVEFYVDGKLVGIVNSNNQNMLFPPGNVSVGSSF